MPRRCSLHPYQLGEWVRPHQDGGERNFKFYTAINDLANPNCIFEADPEPLLKLLAKNDYCPQSPAQWLGNPRAFAFCSTENLAMLLGFHAFGRIVLNLVEIKTNLMMAAANAHPFGHFWLVAEETLRGWVTGKTVEVAYRTRLITQQFDGNSKSVAVSTSAPAPSLLNSLTSHGTDVPDADGERERHWKTVQGERKRFVSFSVPKTWTSDGLGGAFRSAGKVFNHSGTLNSSHRLIVASADLLHEEGDEPWLSLQSPASNLWKDIVTFCSSASGNTDFVMLFDGRMRQIRRTNESWLS